MTPNTESKLGAVAKPSKAKPEKPEGAGDPAAMLAGTQLPDGRKISGLSHGDLHDALSALGVPGVMSAVSAPAGGRLSGNTRQANIALYRQFCRDAYEQAGEDALTELGDKKNGADE